MDKKLKERLDSWITRESYDDKEDSVHPDDCDCFYCSRNEKIF
jgi:hypothetical protein